PADVQRKSDSSLLESHVVLTESDTAKLTGSGPESTTSAAGPSMRESCGTTSSTLSRAHQAMSSASPLACRLRALWEADSPALASAKLGGRGMAPAAESAVCPPSPSAIRPAQ